MAQLSSYRWIKNSVNPFSSEDSMRDYLSSNPSLLFEDNSWVIPIKEEKYLPKSSLKNRQAGRADIILCRMQLDRHSFIHAEEKILDFSKIEFWIVELKKEEASYENGFIQLFDYLTIVKSDTRLQKEIKNEIFNNVRVELNINKSHLKIIDSEIPLFGSIVAPSFDLISKRQMIKNYENEYKEYYDKLEGRLNKHKNNDFTLLDFVLASANCGFILDFILMKLIRFRKDDEVMFFSENILGSKSSAKVSRLDPVKIFDLKLINEDEIFNFKDLNGKIYNKVKCKVLNKRGPSHTFMIMINDLGGTREINLPYKWDKGSLKFDKYNVPSKEITVKNCSMGLHLYFNVFDESQLQSLYWSFGDENFVKESDGKSLTEIKADFKAIQ